MSEPVDVVAEMVAAATRAADWLHGDGLVPWADSIRYLIAEVERLQAENLELCKNNLAFAAENDRLRAENAALMTKQYRHE